MLDVPAGPSPGQYMHISPAALPLQVPTFSACVHSRARSEGIVNIQMDHMLH